MSTTVRDRDLVAWLARALTPGRALEIADEVAASPELQLRVRELGGSLDEPPPPPPRWRLPPPGMRIGPVSMQVVVDTATFGPDDDGLAPGAHVGVYLEDLPDAEQRLVVVLLRGSGEWSVIFPEGIDDSTTLADLRLDPDGRRVLDLRAPATPGRWRFGVALPEVRSIDLTLGLDARWTGLRDAIAQGHIPVFTTDVTVR